ncbi:uncharacterized protein LOC144162974 [Haemaphysalis longicornis]
MSSGGAVMAAQQSRGNRPNGSDSEDYQVILPQLPTGRIVVNTLFLHGDVKARPFKVEDFRDALARTGLLSEVVALGAYQINHVWAITFNSAESTKRMLEVTELQVKGRRCVIIDPQDQQVRLKLHWLLHGVADEDIRAALAPYGKVAEVNRERWRVQGVTDKGSTTRTVLLKLKRGIKLDDLPHQIRVAGELALVVVPGRPMQCLRCNGQGHVRRECKVPRCTQCRRFGHLAAQCVPSYASVMGRADPDASAEHLMDVAEAEEAAQGTGGSETPGTTATTPSEADADAEEGDAEDSRGTLTSEEEGADKSDERRSNAGASGEALVQGEETMDADMAVTAAGSAKRPHGDEKDDAGDAHIGEPPVKATQGRRLSLRPRPTIPPDRNPAEIPPGQRSPSDSAAAGENA